MRSWWYIDAWQQARQTWATPGGGWQRVAARGPFLDDLAGAGRAWADIDATYYNSTIRTFRWTGSRWVIEPGLTYQAVNPNYQGSQTAGIRRSGIDGVIQRVGVGAGPGPSRTYYVDLPQPWGANTPVALPVQALADDIWNVLAPRLDQGSNELTMRIKDAVAQGVSAPLEQGLASGAVIVQKVSVGATLGALAAGAVAGYAAATLTH